MFSAFIKPGVYARLVLPEYCVQREIGRTGVEDALQLLNFSGEQGVCVRGTSEDALNFDDIACSCLQMMLG